MKLSELVKNLKDARVAGSDVDVSDVTYSSTSVKNGSCFVAVKGEKVDGCDFIQDAVKKGASVVVSERQLDLPQKVTNVVVPDARVAMAFLASRLSGDPTKDMTLVGVTGTNGKTTTTYLLESMFRAAGKNPGVIGTIGYRYNEIVKQATHTTPESTDLQKLFKDMKDAHVDSVAMEVSSHSLSQKRVYGCHFDAAVFTNLTPEHLDYHNDMEDYFEAKAVLFEKLVAESGKRNVFAVINYDDAYGRRLLKNCPVRAVSYGFSAGCVVMGEDLKMDETGMRFKINTHASSFECRSSFIGRFNAENILAAAATAHGLGISDENICRGIESVKVVPGRFESVVNKKGILAIVDYAHTPDALTNVLKYASEISSAREGKLICVFGCGGDRDRKKRPLMGEVAGKISDYVIVTNDNPRTEVPSAIIDEILTGIKKVCDAKEFEVIEDRKKAIGRAIEMANKGDVVIVAGKGHEDYQILGSKRIHFSDREVLGEFLI